MFFPSLFLPAVSSSLTALVCLSSCGQLCDGHPSAFAFELAPALQPASLKQYFSCPPVLQSVKYDGLDMWNSLYQCNSVYFLISQRFERVLGECHPCTLADIFRRLPLQVTYTTPHHDVCRHRPRPAASRVQSASLAAISLCLVVLSPCRCVPYRVTDCRLGPGRATRMFSFKQQSKDKGKAAATGAAAGGATPAPRLRAGQLRAQKGTFGWNHAGGYTVAGM